VRDATADAEARALAAKEGIAVLRAELAEERERAQEADAPEAARSDDPDRTQVLSAVEPAGDADAAEDDTRPFTVSEERDVEGDAVPLAAVPPEPRGSRPPQRSGGAWVAVLALALFVFVLLGLLLGFLP
jgi:hypothetical protein